MKWILEEKISKLYVSLKALDKIEHEELSKAILLFEKLKGNLLKLTEEKAYYHTMYAAQSDFIFDTPYDKRLIGHALYEHIAETFNVPVSWVSLIPLAMYVSNKSVYAKVENWDWDILDKDGYVFENVYAAFVDGQLDGLIPEDEPFPYQRPPKVVEIHNNAKEYLEGIAKQMNVPLSDVIGNKPDDIYFPTDEEV